MKKLIFAIHDLNSWGGQDRSTLEIARRLSHRWPVEIWSYTLEDTQGIESWGDVTFHQIKPHPRRPAALKQNLYYAATLPLVAKSDRVIHATGACSLVSDVIQVQFVQAAWRAKLREMRANGSIPHDLSVRDAYQSALLKYNCLVEKAVFRKKKTYIAIARGVAQELEAHFGIRERVHVIHHGVDSELFHPVPRDDRARAWLRGKLAVREDQILILLVGALERKGLNVAIAALAKIPGELREKVRLIAVGDGPADRFEMQAETLGVRSQLRLVGHQKNILPYYQAADLFILPTSYEPFGLVVTEAMASGLPCLVSACAGAAELIEDDRSGKLIDDPASSDEVARKLIPLLENGDFRRGLGEEARKTAVMRSWDRVAREYAEVLRPMVEDPR